MAGVVYLGGVGVACRDGTPHTKPHIHGDLHLGSCVFGYFYCIISDLSPPPAVPLRLSVSVAVQHVRVHGTRGGVYVLVGRGLVRTKHRAMLHISYVYYILFISLIELEPKPQTICVLCEKKLGATWLRVSSLHLRFRRLATASTAQLCRFPRNFFSPGGFH